MIKHHKKKDFRADVLLFRIWKNNKNEFKNSINSCYESLKKKEKYKFLNSLDAIIINKNSIDDWFTTSWHIRGGATVEDFNDFKNDIEVICDELYNTHRSQKNASILPPNIEQKLLKALDYGDNYKNLVEKTEADIDEKYLRDNVQNIKDHEKLKKEHQDYLKIRTEKKELRQDLKDIDALCNASQARLAEVYAKLPPQYQRSWVTKATMATIDTLEDLASERGIPNFVTNAVKGYINKRIHSTNFQQAFDTMSVFSGETAPEPELHRLERPNVHEAIAKIETPLQKLNSILPALTSENITTVSDEVLGRLFDTSAIMAACDELDINERFKPLLKSLEIMPDEKFRDNSVLNHEKIFIVTDLIKYSIRLGRGDIATDLMKHFIPKIKTGNPELMLDANETSDCFRQELSDITALSIELSKVDRQLNPVEKRKPLNKLLELTQATTIPEFTSYDPTEPMDIPVTGYLPEIINSTIADLGQGETETLNAN